MALKGSVSTSSYTADSGSKWSVVLDWTATQNVSENTSTISWDLKVSTKSSSYVVISELRVKIDGTEVYYRDKTNHTDGYNGTTLASGTKTITHNNDGSKSINISVEAGIYVWAINQSGSSTFTLDTIPRASSITNASNVTIGKSCSIKWTPMASTFYYKLRFSIGSWSATTSAINPNTTSSYTYTGYTIPNNVANQLTSATSGTMTVTLYTYANSSCSTVIGSTSSKTFTVTVPNSMTPTVDTISLEIDNSNNDVVNDWGIAVAGYTKIRVKANGSGSYGSTISSYTITGGYSKTISGASLDYTGGVISSSGNHAFDIICTDSRGRTSAQAYSDIIEFYPYSKPNVTSLTVERDSSDKSKIIVKGNWSFDSVNSKNSASGTLYYKESTKTNWTQYGTISKNTETELTVNFDQTISYNFKLVVTDALSNTAQEEAFISTMEVLLDFRAGGKGLGIGKICESDSMEVSLDAKFFGEVYINSMTLEEYIKSIINSS